MGEELTGQVVLVLVVGKDGDDSRCEGEDDAIQAANVSQNGPESVGRSLHEFGVACHFKLDQHSREKLIFIPNAHGLCFLFDYGNGGLLGGSNIWNRHHEVVIPLENRTLDLKRVLCRH